MGDTSPPCHPRTPRWSRDPTSGEVGLGLPELRASSHRSRLLCSQVSATQPPVLLPESQPETASGPCSR